MSLEVGQSRTVNLTLALGPVAESVTVSDVAPLLTTNRADRGTVVENQFLVSIPLPTRNPLLLVTLTAGVIPGNVLVAGDNSQSQNQTNEFRINGGRMQTSEVLIDGASNTMAYNNQVAAIPQVDAIQEFKVNTNPVRRRVRPHRRRRYQLHDQVRDQQLPRQPARVPPEPGAERRRVRRQSGGPAQGALP
jgi:hypothetical protein